MRKAGTALAMLALIAGAALCASLLAEVLSSSPSPSGEVMPAALLDRLADGAGIHEADDEEGFPEVDWEYWQTQNADVVGWVSVPGTSISQPVMRAPVDDDDFYLHHDVSKRPSLHGVPFVSSACAEGLASRHTVIFAHHLRLGGMFSELANAPDRSWLRRHETVLLQTPDEKVRLDLAAARRVNADKEGFETSFATDEQFDAWWRDERSKAVLAERAPERCSQVVTLVTCSYAIWENERTLVHATRGQDVISPERYEAGTPWP